MNTWDISGMCVVLWSITANIKTCEFARKPQSYFYHHSLQFSFAHAWLSFFSYNTCSRNICGVCLEIVDCQWKGQSIRLYLFNLLGNIIFYKKGHPYIHLARKTIIYSSFLLCIICLLNFCPFYRTPPIWKCFGNFHTHHKLDITTFVGLKGRHQKWQLRMAVPHLWFHAFQVSKAFSWPSKLVWDTLFCDWGV